MNQWTRSPLVQIMASCLFCNKTLWESMLETCSFKKLQHACEDTSSTYWEMKNVWISIKISLKFVYGVKLTTFQHWFRKWLGVDQATSHYLKQWWIIYIYESFGLSELICLNISYHALNETEATSWNEGNFIPLGYCRQNLVTFLSQNNHGCFLSNLWSVIEVYNGR